MNLLHMIGEEFAYETNESSISRILILFAKSKRILSFSWILQTSSSIVFSDCNNISSKHSFNLRFKEIISRVLKLTPFVFLIINIKKDQFYVIYD